MAFNIGDGNEDLMVYLHWAEPGPRPRQEDSSDQNNRVRGGGARGDRSGPCSRYY